MTQNLRHGSKGQAVLQLDVPAAAPARLALRARLRDGRASERVLAATEALLAGELGTLRRKPLSSIYRGLQIRRELGYWGRAAR